MAPSLTPAAPLARSDLAGATLRPLNLGGRRNPDVYLLSLDGRLLVLKDFAARPAWVRCTVGRWITRREGRAWHALSGHPAVPEFVGFVDALALLVEYRPGKRMSRKLSGEVPVDFVDRLEDAVREMHRRGVVHLDLRHRTNVLADAAGQPVLIDFGSACAFRPGSLGARLLLPLLARVDLGAVRKWRRKLTGQPAAGSPVADGAGSSGRGRGASRPT